MMATTSELGARRGFHGGDWRSAVDVRAFIQDNYTPYEVGESLVQHRANVIAFGL